LKYICNAFTPFAPSRRNDPLTLRLYPLACMTGHCVHLRAVLIARVNTGWLRIIPVSSNNDEHPESGVDCNKAHPATGAATEAPAPSATESTTRLLMPLIYHITRKTDWDAALSVGRYAADRLRTEGFIHCSTVEQVLATANRLFRGKTGLALLCIEADKVGAEIRHENLEGGTSLFPHVYGALEIASIAAVHDFPPQADGSFVLPADTKLMRSKGIA
jgi:uncharacterized protein (DUF952 family)